MENTNAHFAGRMALHLICAHQAILQQSARRARVHVDAVAHYAAMDWRCLPTSAWPMRQEQLDGFVDKFRREVGTGPGEIDWAGLPGTGGAQPWDQSDRNVE